MTDRPKNKHATLGNYVQNIVLAGMMRAVLALPYPVRLRFFGWVMSRIVGPVAGYNRRVRENLSLVMPELPEAEVRHLMRRVPANAGRTLIEIYSGKEFKTRAAARTTLSGAGLEALNDAIARKQGVILVSGHFGNYDVPRAVFAERGHPVGGVYRKLKNPYFHDHYLKAVREISDPVFATGERRDMARMVRFLKDGGLLGMLVDLHIGNAPKLEFFGHAAHTALSAAELALKYDLLMVPVYAVRTDDEGSFDMIVEPPVPHSTPEQMMQAINDSLEQQVRAHLDQWFWIHRRWADQKRRRKRKPNA